MFFTGHTELRNHIMYSAAVAVTSKKDVGMGLCMFNFVFMSSPLPLHTAMPIYTLFEYFLAWSSLHIFAFFGNVFSDLYNI